MNHFFLKFLIFFFFSFNLNCQTFNEIKEPSKCIKKIKTNSNSTNSIKADFTELKHSVLFKNPIPGSGIFYFQKKDNIRWEQQTPIKNIILISEGKIKIQENGKEIKSVSSNKVANKIQDLMLQLISGDFLKQNEFSISYFENNVTYKLILKPKSKRLKKYISKIEVYFDIEKGFCKQLSFIENESNYTTYTFLNQKINTEIPSSVFKNF